MKYHVIAAIASFCLATVAHAGELTFYGFHIGEDQTASQKNMRARDLVFIGADAHAEDVAHRRSTFVALKNPDRCEEDGSAELRTTTCSMAKGDIQQLVLYHLHGRLVRLVAQFRSGVSDLDLKRLKERFGSDLRTAPKEYVAEMEGIYASPSPGLKNILENPFGYTKQCNQCSLSFFAQKSEGDYVVLIKDPQITAISLFSDDLITKQIPLAVDQRAKSESTEDKNREF